MKQTMLTGVPQPRVAHSALGGQGGGPAGRGPGHHQHQGGDRPLPLRRAGAHTVADQVGFIMFWLGCLLRKYDFIKMHFSSSFAL